MARKGKTKKATPKTETYQHPTASSPMGPEVGTQARFRKTKPAVTYWYDSSLEPQLSWDDGQATREEGETLIREILDAGDLASIRWSRFNRRRPNGGLTPSTPFASSRTGSTHW